MIFAIESLRDCWDEIMVLASAHWQETEAYRHGQPFAPSFNRYIQYEDMGCVMQVTGRVNGELVAYATLYITESMHSQCKICVEDTFFIAKTHRKGLNAVKLYKFVENECKKRGVVEVIFTSKNPAVDRILKYLDFQPVAAQYSKQLGRADSTHD